MRTGFVGLGEMGRAMVSALLRAGHEVTVWNRTWSRAEALQGEGASVGAMPAEVAREGVVVSMLARPHANLVKLAGGDLDWSAFGRTAAEDAGSAAGTH